MKQKNIKKQTRSKRFIEMVKFSLTKQTQSDKRKHLFGSDPLKK